MNKNQFHILIALVVVAIIVGLRFTPAADYLSFANLVAQKDNLHHMASEHYFIFVLSYIAIYTFAAAVSFPGAAILTMAGGFVFGTFPTALYVNLAATTGAAGAFLVARYLVGDYFQSRYALRLKRFNDELRANGANYLFTLRLIPIFPFFVINILAGLTKVSLKKFVWTTSLGIIPGSLTYSFAGAQLNYIESPKDVLSGKVLLAFAALAILGLIPVIYKKIKGK